ncbi:sigma-54 dependent transcriptional regulator [Massilibacteroides sp.]|uniref:sigma-54-dependent transcriptional regulator n=1 Tax=Massilibacteroides sp. TaxID=2034766 RepID=UPI00260A5A89|nr:sigma-54 dependent transcriptional regulator [Massilibacteroides sp.]MDD4516452.1 sigma-54 dependent transcriptional regulator [Massilibacteroides sp.]
MLPILIVEDDITFSLMLSTWLKKKGFDVTSIATIVDAKKIIEKKQFDLILSDLRLPDGDGIDLLKWLENKQLSLPVIVMTGYAEVQTAVQAMKLGASDYISKPINPQELLKKIEEISAIKEESVPVVREIAEEKHEEYIQGKSNNAVQMYDHVKLVAPTDMSVLITGESGTGKEYIARLIHLQSSRSKAPFVAVDCGAIPKDLAASEFFGHIKGSFTGAIDNKTGAFVAADGGTIFLDEIGNLTYEIQVQLLRALQERKVKPVGSNQELPINVRLISATNENLRQAIDNGEFREDLYHRINEFTIRIPSLQERKEDIILFANHFLDQANSELNKSIVGFDEAVTKLFCSYSWPGNLRQMKNSVKYGTLLAVGKFITLNDLPEELTVVKDTKETNPVVQLKSEDHERSLIVRALQETENNKSKAAKLLGIDRKTLYNKLKIYNID